MTCVGQLICDNNYRPFSLTYPTAPFSSNKIEEEDKSGPRISLSAGAVVLDKDLPSAIENHLSANNIKFKLGLDGKTENKHSRFTVSADLEGARTFHPQANDTSHFTPMNVEGMLELKTCRYFNIIMGMGLKTATQSYRSATYFYPNSGEFEPWGKGGIQINIPQSKTSLAALFEYRQIWGNYIFDNVISDNFEFMGAVENRGTLGIQFAQKFNNRFAPDITAYFEYSLFGGRHVPEVLVVGDKTVVDIKIPMDTKEISAGLALDWKPFSVAGKYEYRGSEFWPSEHTGSFNAEYRNKKYGDYGLGWKGLFGIDPASPFTTHDIQIMARGPFLNRSLGLSISFFDDHFTFMPTVDVMRFIRHFN